MVLVRAVEIHRLDGMDIDIFDHDLSLAM
ncbi:uncharacterized protein METZ01_LOCUS370365 [marine metagenome]|uniref:Uncharacterized protein n=1 Tax=marine metagenome TaxID=408172 RepID=A0A382T872_9ZZZZ